MAPVDFPAGEATEVFLGRKFNCAWKFSGIIKNTSPSHECQSMDMHPRNHWFCRNGLSLAFWSSYIDFIFFFFNLLAGTLGTCTCPRTVRLLQISIILRINLITLQQCLFLISVFPSLCSCLMIEIGSFCMDQIWKQYLEGLIQSQDMKSGVLFLPLTFERCF